MTRAYLRLDPAYDERKSHYPDGPYATFIACLCLGESQPERGRFRSLRYLKALLDKRSKHAQYLVEHGDLAVMPDGRIYIDGWDEWQEGDLTVGERVKRLRSRRCNGPRNGDVTANVTVDVTAPVLTVEKKQLSAGAGAGVSEAPRPRARTNGLEEWETGEPETTSRLRIIDGKYVYEPPS